MSILRKMKSLAVLTCICAFLVSTSLTSCGKKGQAAEENGTEHPAGEAENAEHPEGEAEKSEHPAGEAEHPTNKSDTTKVEEQ